MLSLNPHKDSMQQLYGYCSRSAIMAAAAAAAATQNTRQIMPDKPGRETALFQFSIYNGKKWKEPRRLLFQFSTFRISCQLSKIVPYVWQAVTTSLRKVSFFDISTTNSTTVQFKSQKSPRCCCAKAEKDFMFEIFDRFLSKRPEKIMLQKS